ncbi:hypothetical protein K438DRAFT_1693823 [Mycena galopus ATCC 62051]|nr:hypothetical protein K438DRAFT_1693823 [Mycena galopus ATCC 62051]
MLFLGYENGLWMVPADSRGSTEMCQVFKGKYITQCVTLQDLGVVLVLGDRTIVRKIWASKIADLFASDNIDHVKWQRVTDWNHPVTRFIAGAVNGKYIIVYLRRATGKEYQLYHVHGMVCMVLQANVANLTGDKPTSWLSKIVPGAQSNWFSKLGTSYADFEVCLHHSPALIDVCWVDGGWAILTRDKTDRRFAPVFKRQRQRSHEYYDKSQCKFCMAERQTLNQFHRI